MHLDAHSLYLHDAMHLRRWRVIDDTDRDAINMHARMHPSRTASSSSSMMGDGWFFIGGARDTSVRVGLGAASDDRDARATTTSAIGESRVGRRTDGRDDDDGRDAGEERARATSERSARRATRSRKRERHPPSNNDARSDSDLTVKTLSMKRH